MDHFDLVVIGGGPGGYPAAIRAAQLGASVALVEKDTVGGTCLNRGCIPTKTLIHAADLYHRIQSGEDFGISASPSLDYEKLIAHKDAVVKKLVGGVESLLKANNVRVYPGTAAFVSPREIAISNVVTTLSIKSNKTIIATGSAPSMPGFIPQHDRILDSRRFLELTQLPNTLLILGGGVIGCEMACMAARFDVHVTIVEMLDDILLLVDKDARRAARRYMEKELNIRILTGQALSDITADDTSVRGMAGETAVEADMMLAAVGRRPVTDGLNLDNAGIHTDDAGHIPVDEYGRTRAPGIFAIGDVNGVWQLAHAATSQGIIAVENALGRTTRRFETLVPNVIFTAPEIATVGLSDDAAKERGIAVNTGKFFFRGLGKGLATTETIGFVKWIADPDSGQLFGATAVGAHVTELIHEAAVAIRAELTVTELGRTIHAHPTFSEAFMEAAHAAHGEAIHAPPARR